MSVFVEMYTKCWSASIGIKFKAGLQTLFSQLKKINKFVRLTLPWNPTLRGHPWNKNIHCNADTAFGPKRILWMLNNPWNKDTPLIRRYDISGMLWSPDWRAVRETGTNERQIKFALSRKRTCLEGSSNHTKYFIGLGHNIIAISGPNRRDNGTSPTIALTWLPRFCN